MFDEKTRRKRGKRTRNKKTSCLLNNGQVCQIVFLGLHFHRGDGRNKKHRNRSKMEWKSFYHKGATRDECIIVLKGTKRLGAYLLRDSETLANTKVLSVLISLNMVANYKLTEKQDGKIGFTRRKARPETHGEEWVFYDSMEELIDKCSLPCTPTVVPLTTPVNEVEYVKMNEPSLDGNENHLKADQDQVDQDDEEQMLKGTGPDERFLELLKCFLCKQLADNALETNCCHVLFCEACVRPLVDQFCLVCNKPFETQESHASRRIIGNMPAICSHDGCKFKTTRSELNAHETKCDFKILDCVFEECDERCRSFDLPQHLFEKHAEKVVESLKGLNQMKLEEKNRFRVNDNGDECAPAANGKFYCGNALDGPRCACCDGVCGPTNGCNCSACMKLDVKTQCLSSGTFVNRNGHPSAKSRSNDNFYCGRVVLERVSNAEGRCGPKRGPNCNACQVIQSLVKTRYAKVWSS